MKKILHWLLAIRFEGGLHGLVTTPPFGTGCRKTEVVNMDQETDFILYEGVVVPESVLLRREKRNPFGSIEGLPDEELADPDELERAYYMELWGPVLMLPKPKSARLNPAWDCDSELGFNAFATVDFDRMMPEYDKVRYKADKLEEERKDLNIMIYILNERIKSKVKYKVLKYVISGIIDADDIRDGDMWQFAKLCMRSVRLKEQIKKLREKSRRTQKEKVEKFWASMGC